MTGVVQFFAQPALLHRHPLHITKPAPQRHQKCHVLRRAAKFDRGFEHVKRPVIIGIEKAFHPRVPEPFVEYNCQLPGDAVSPLSLTPLASRATLICVVTTVARLPAVFVTSPVCAGNCAAASVPVSDAAG